MDGAEQVARYPLSTDYHSLRVDGNRVLLKTAGRFDLFRLTGDALEFLRGYSLDSPVFDFEMHEGLLFLLTSRADVQHLGAFQIVDLSVEEPRQVAEAIPELIGEVPMFKAGHDLALDGHYAYILDNTMAPYYLGIIDIADPRNPVAEWREFAGVNESLVGQDIGERWFVLSVSSTIFGSRSRLGILSKEPPPMILASLGVGFVPPEGSDIGSGVIKGFTAGWVSVENGNLLFVGHMGGLAMAFFDASSPEAPELIWTRTIEPKGMSLDPDVCRGVLAMRSGAKSVLLLEVNADGPVELHKIARYEAIRDVTFDSRC